MDRLGFTAMSAAARTMQALQVKANNLANVSTTGFRADIERAVVREVEGQGYGSRFMTEMQNNGVDMQPGTMMPTGRELDFAIRGPGLIALQDGEVERYTRNGSLQVDANLMLTLNGRPVLGQGGPIQLPEYDSLTIGNDGTVSVIPRGDYLTAEVDRIRLVEIDPADLVKDESGLLMSKTGQAGEPAETTTLVAGFLEGSNVSAINELVGTMSLSRLFEAQVKMMKAAEDTSGAGNRLIRGS